MSTKQQATLIAYIALMTAAPAAITYGVFGLVAGNFPIAELGGLSATILYLAVPMGLTAAFLAWQAANWLRAKELPNLFYMLAGLLGFGIIQLAANAGALKLAFLIFLPIILPTALAPAILFVFAAAIAPAILPHVFPRKKTAR